MRTAAYGTPAVRSHPLLAMRVTSSSRRPLLAAAFVASACVLALVLARGYASRDGEAADAVPPAVAASAHGGEDPPLGTLLVPPRAEREPATATDSKRAAVAAAAADPELGSTEAPLLRVRCVRAEDELPIAHAVVQAVDRSEDEQAWLTRYEQVGLLGVMIPGAGPSARADEFGIAWVARPDDDAEPQGGAWIGRAAGRSAIGFLSEAIGDELVLRFIADRELTVRVSSSDGAAMPGVRVGLHSLGFLAMDLAYATSGADGLARFALPGPAGEELEFREHVVRAAGLFREVVEAPLGEDIDPVTLVLPPCGWVELRPATRLAADLRVELSAYGAGAGSADEPLVTWLAPAGVAAVPVAVGLDVRAEGGLMGSGHLWARAGPAVPWRSAGRGPSREGERVTLTLRRDKALRLIGRAVDEGDVPLAHATLYAWIDGAIAVGKATDPFPVPCDADGRFVFELPATAESLGSIVLRAFSDAVERVFHVAHPKTAHGEFHLGDVVLAPRAPMAIGRLVDRWGRPIAGGTVRGLHDFETASDEHGRFVLEGDEPPGAALKLRAVAAGFAEQSRAIVVGEDLGEWVLSRTPSVRVRLIGAERLPPHAKLAVSFEHMEAPHARMWLEADGAIASGTVDRPGRWRVRVAFAHARRRAVHAGPPLDVLDSTAIQEFDVVVPESLFERVPRPEHVPR